MQPSNDRLYGSLQLFLQRVFSLVEGDAMERLVELDVTLSQARTTLLLSHVGEPVTISDIARRLGLSVAAAGRNVDQLVRLGIAERHDHPTDRRVTLVSLSPTGLEAADQHLDHKRKALRILVDRLPDADCDRLHEALQPILQGDYLSTSTTTKDLSHVNS
ncbi:MarR family winged helix-turn-helix transcriptional regulator [Solicola sp. PLA-1-18]|uniref:MarR family winged helix-turn-helix transcriptional regulator n=1 Tax=Solicola sp. PLA-1-18 TaxID=3380532 RepID=UPI003B7C16DF